MKVLKNLVANFMSFDNEGEYKKIEVEMKKLSKEKSVFEYASKGSLIKKHLTIHL